MKITKKKYKGFTLVELVIVIAIIALLMAVIIPKLANEYQEGKEKIIDIYNGVTYYRIYLDGELFYEGEEMPNLAGYKMTDIQVIGNEVSIEIEEE